MKESESTAFAQLGMVYVPIPAVKNITLNGRMTSVDD